MESMFEDKRTKKFQLIFVDDDNLNRPKRLRKKSKQITTTIIADENTDDDTDTGDSLASTSISTIHLSELDDCDIIDNNNRTSTPKLKKTKFDLHEHHHLEQEQQQQQQDNSNKKQRKKRPQYSNVFERHQISKSLESTKKIKIIGNNNNNNNQIISNKNKNSHNIKQQQQQQQKQNLSQNQLLQQQQQQKEAATDAAATTAHHHDHRKIIVSFFGKNIRHGQISDKSEQHRQQQTARSIVIDEEQNRSIDGVDGDNSIIRQQQRRSIDEEIHSRYKHYLQLKTDLKDQNKTDYTYAHSSSYSPLVQNCDWYNWTVPNMSRQSVRHHHHNNNRSLSPTNKILQSDMIQRRFNEHGIPVSTISSTQQSLATRRIVSSSSSTSTTTGSYQQNAACNETHIVRPRIPQQYHNIHHHIEQPFHSTPFKPNILDAGSSGSSLLPQQSTINKTTTKTLKSSNIEFSDDDDDNNDNNGGFMNETNLNDEEDLNQTVKMTLRKPIIIDNNGDEPMKISKRRMVKSSYSRTRSNQNNLGHYSEEDDDNGMEDDTEDEEEEFTFIRRIQRFFITTVRHIPYIGSSDLIINNKVPSTNNNDLNLNETYTSSSTSSRLNVYQNNDHMGGDSMFFLPKTSSSGTWFRQRIRNNHNLVDNDEVMIDSSKLGFCSPGFCFKIFLGLFLFLFLLPLLISYLLGPGSSSYYQMLQWTTNAIDLHSSSPSSSSFVELFSSLSIWPSFLSLNSLSKWPSLFSSYSPPAGESYRSVFDSEISALRKELLSLKEMNQQKYDSISNPAASMPPPTIMDPRLVERIHELESQLTTCCNRSNTTTWDRVRSEIENEITRNMDSKLSQMQQRYDEELKSQVENVRLNLIQLIDEYRNRVDMNLSMIIDQIRSELIEQQQLVQRQKHTGSSNIKIDSISLIDVERLIHSALAKYDADKTGEADFALESSGGWIMQTRCSESYELSWGTYKLLGMTIWRSINSPRVVIQSGVVPGECWCFKGSEGRLGIHLSARIIPTAFTYEHIPAELSRDGHIKSAPNRLIVYGLRHEHDLDPIILGEYYYQIDDVERPLQQFLVQNQEAAKHTFDMIELNVKSNHGHPDYTCLYRFRVHGIHPSITNA
ncbi:uncharacterized protein LOC124490759 isoform X2 [Dermatophagoides farinae]|uniref:uncharacterized protein LOC124490759 isoform X2 n=1 Tax=Dermatophagoides farinae TaxID=6954 RepID=UPI003F5EF614